MSQPEYDELDEFEKLINEDDVPSLTEMIEELNDEYIQLVCPICQEKDFKFIYIPNAMHWYQLPIRNLLPKRNRIQAYRCLHCDYVLIFAREKNR